MICQNCQREIGEQKKCPYCGSENTVSVLSPLEKEYYSGTTIDEAAGSSDYRFERRKERFFKKSLLKGGWVTKLVVGAALLSFAAFFIFVALPFISIAVLSALVMYVVFRFLR